MTYTEHHLFSGPRSSCDMYQLSLTKPDDALHHRKLQNLEMVTCP